MFSKVGDVWKRKKFVRTFSKPRSCWKATKHRETNTEQYRLTATATWDFVCAEYRTCNRLCIAHLHWLASSTVASWTFPFVGRQVVGSTREQRRLGEDPIRWNNARKRSHCFFASDSSSSRPPSATSRDSRPARVRTRIGSSAGIVDRCDLDWGASRPLVERLPRLAGAEWLLVPGDRGYSGVCFPSNRGAVEKSDRVGRANFGWALRNLGLLFVASYEPWALAIFIIFVATNFRHCDSVFGPDVAAVRCHAARKEVWGAIGPESVDSKRSVKCIAPKRTLTQRQYSYTCFWSFRKLLFSRKRMW